MKRDESDIGADAFWMLLPPWVEDILRILEEKGNGEAWIVGGAVRDTALGNPVNDYDLASSLPAQTAIKLINDAGYTAIPTGIAHGTITALIGEHRIEITTFRTDGPYSDGRHPDVVSPASSIQEDLARRDFTMNAMAYHPRRGLIDPYGGMQALRAREIVCVGDPTTRFREDALRILRALRFSAQYNFSLEIATEAAACTQASSLRALSGERIWHELQLLLCGENVAYVLLRYPNILAEIIPEIDLCAACQQHTKYHCYDVWEHIAHTVEEMPPTPLGRLAAL